MILVVDNYDSFVFNLARHFERLGAETCVRRNDELTVAEVRRLRPAAVVVSPGPCTPGEAGCSLDLVRELHRELPMLGVCLGHQVLAAALGGTIVRAEEPMHGRTSLVHHDGQGLFAGVPSPFAACRYHSLVVEPGSLPEELEATARTADGVIMALAHRRYPVWGVQFHPEAILTEHGYLLLANFLRLAGLPTNSAPLPCENDHLADPPPTIPTRPVTF